VARKKKKPRADTDLEVSKLRRHPSLPSGVAVFYQKMFQSSTVEIVLLKVYLIRKTHIKVKRSQPLKKEREK